MPYQISENDLYEAKTVRVERTHIQHKFSFIFTRDYYSKSFDTGSSNWDLMYL